MRNYKSETKAGDLTVLILTFLTKYRLCFVCNCKDQFVFNLVQCNKTCILTFTSRINGFGI